MCWLMRPMLKIEIAFAPYYRGTGTRILLVQMLNLRLEVMMQILGKRSLARYRHRPGISQSRDLQGMRASSLSAVSR